MRERLGRLRRRLYPLNEARPQEWRIGLAILGVLALLSLCVRAQGWDFRLEGLIPVPAYPVWAAINLYVLIGVVWELLDPTEEKTAGIRRGRRLLFACLAVLAATVSLTVVWLW